MARFRTTFRTEEQAKRHAKRVLENKTENSTIVGVAGIHIINHGRNRGRFEINWLLDATKFLTVSAFEEPTT